LQSLRVARGLTRQALERLSGAARGRMILYERGWQVPRLETVARLAQVLGPGLVGDK
jgi:transcriptional regulator with XRE-family HTH domain